MQIDIATLFPEMCDAVLQESILGRAQKSGAISVQCWNIRDYTLNKHKRVDDVPYGGGRGMVMQADPIYRCWEAVCAERESKPHCIYLSPKGSVFTQQKAVALSQLPHLFLLCGHYEGIDERVLEEIVTDYVSIGDYVLTGGELPAMVMVDAISRMVPGVLANDESGTTESFEGNLLEYPQYSRPEDWMGKKVPAILLSGDHAKVEAWRREQSIKRTMERRPDLLADADLTAKEKAMVEHLLDKSQGKC